MEITKEALQARIAELEAMLEMRDGIHSEWSEWTKDAPKDVLITLMSEVTGRSAWMLNGNLVAFVELESQGLTPAIARKLTASMNINGARVPTLYDLPMDILVQHGLAIPIAKLIPADAMVSFDVRQIIQFEAEFKYRFRLHLGDYHVYQTFMKNRAEGTE